VKIKIVGVLAIGTALALSTAPAWAQGYDNSNDDVICQTITKGVIKFKPALNNVGSALPQSIQVGGTLGACKSNTNANLVFPEGKSKFKGILSIPTSPGCLGLLGPSAASGSLTFTFNATDTTVPASPQPLLFKTATVTVSSGGTVGGLATIGLGAYGQFGLGSPQGGTALAVAGGFTGGDGGSTSEGLVFTQQAADTISTFCGLTPPLGVKQINIGVGVVHLK
jgi:hypothetical protein